MNKILQIIIDTNIFVAAFRSQKGVANLLLQKLKDVRWQVNVSTPLLLEYEDVLKRPEMNEFISENDVDIFLNGVCTIANYHEIYYLWRLLAKDPNDSFLLELAVKANAEFIITYNPKDFPAAASFGIKLVTPKEFLQFVGDL
ncbi:MAG: putative toxin-antitoxin system toxin component, PIN family [Acidobacteriota bacterium]|nr:putative toxin-antitoxin system toxin component, PIN family [Acidobacteriota bacterium]